MPKPMCPSTSKKTSSGPAGILVLIKPPGLTSQSAVTLVKKTLGVRQAGHTGTLDPDACGVLPVPVGKATRIIPFLPEGPKAYRGEVTLGISTDTQDASGRPEKVRRGFRLRVEAVLEAFSSFLGKSWQVPPMVSAVHVNGQRLYELARQGKVVERSPRLIEVYELKVLDIDPGPEGEGSGQGAFLGFGSRILFEVKASRGFYVRTLCHDLGVKLGIGAHLSFLVRTLSYPFSLSQGVTTEEMESLGAATPLISLDQALAEHPSVTLAENEMRRVKHGNAITRPLPAAVSLVGAKHVRLSGPDGCLIAVARVGTDRRAGAVVLQPERVLEEIE